MLPRYQLRYWRYTLPAGSSPGGTPRISAETNRDTFVWNPVANLQAILGAIGKHYDSEPTVTDVLLYFRGKDTADRLPQSANRGFKLVPMEYKPTLGNYIEM